MDNPEMEDFMFKDCYPFKTVGMIHSRNAMGEFTIEKKVGDNRYEANVEGITCTAIFNPFSGMFYADDVYGVVTAHV